jgi:hypothetical protein
VKEQHIAGAKSREAQALASFRDPVAAKAAAE